MINARLAPHEVDRILDHCSPGAAVSPPSHPRGRGPRRPPRRRVQDQPTPSARLSVGGLAPGRAGRPEQRRPGRGDDLHLRHDRPPQGRHADPPHPAYRHRFGAHAQPGRAAKSTACFRSATSSAWPASSSGRCASGACCSCPASNPAHLVARPGEDQIAVVQGVPPCSPAPWSTWTGRPDPGCARAGLYVRRRRTAGPRLKARSRGASSASP